jgi:cyclophilin family peptidyl-prolyl cis-trans isomerase
MTPYELELAARGYYDTVRHKRIIAYTMIQLWGDPKKMPTIEQFWPLPYDGEGVSNELTDDDLKQIFAEIDKK